MNRQFFAAFALFMAIGFGGPFPVEAQDSNADQSGLDSAEDLIRAMHDRYRDSWYESLTFVQRTVQYSPSGDSTVGTWYEAALLPGRLRIDFAPLEDDNLLLFANDSTYSIRNGEMAGRRGGTNPLLLLGFDVYKYPVGKTLEKLNDLNFDLSIMREDSWQGRDVYVVGAEAGDGHSMQFWVDKERLYFVRMLSPMGPNGSQTQDVRFNRYERLAGGWIAPEVLFFRDGNLGMTEHYSDVRANVELDPRLFDPDRWSEARWWQ